MEEMIVVRCGYQDWYNYFVDLHGAIEYLQHMQVTNDLKKFGKTQFTCSTFEYNNPLWIFCSSNKQLIPIRDLTEEEIDLMKCKLIDKKDIIER